MGYEIERKFLVRKDLWYALEKPVGTFISQAYLLNEPGKVIRIRVTDSSGFITIKGAVVNIRRPEYEYEIPHIEALEIIERFTINKIEKIRYNIEFHGHIWEVDEFFGENDGLIVAEIELDSVDEPFKLPGWIANEVSDDHRYYNSYLCEHPFQQWE